MKKNQKSWSEMDKQERIGLVLVLGIIGFLIITFVPGIGKDKSSPQATQSPPKATYDATVNSFKVLDPATIVVALGVQNNNNVEGQPNCLIQASNTNGTYKGFDSFKTNTIIPAGEKRGLVANLTITNEGAEYITDITAECTI